MFPQLTLGGSKLYLLIVPGYEGISAGVGTRGLVSGYEGISAGVGTRGLVPEYEGIGVGVRGD